MFKQPCAASKAPQAKTYISLLVVKPFKQIKAKNEKELSK